MKTAKNVPAPVSTLKIGDTRFILRDDVESWVPDVDPLKSRCSVVKGRVIATTKDSVLFDDGRFSTEGIAIQIIRDELPFYVKKVESRLFEIRDEKNREYVARARTARRAEIETEIKVLRGEKGVLTGLPYRTVVRLLNTYVGQSLRELKGETPEDTRKNARMAIREALRKTPKATSKAIRELEAKALALTPKSRVAKKPARKVA